MNDMVRKTVILKYHEDSVKIVSQPLSNMNSQTMTYCNVRTRIVLSYMNKIRLYSFLLSLVQDLCTFHCIIMMPSKCRFLVLKRDQLTFSIVTLCT